MRTATKQDFKEGVKLLDLSNNEFTLVKQAYENDSDMWIGKTNRGEKIIFVSEAQYYIVE